MRINYPSDLLKGQNPEKVVVCCSDSRESETKYTNWEFVPGKIFVVRNAGNCALFLDALASIRYAALHLNVKEIEIAGHYNCGMMNALLRFEEEEDEVIREACGFIISKVFKGYENVKGKSPEELAKINVVNQVKILSEDKVIKEWINRGGILKGTYFDFSKTPLVVETLIVEKSNGGNDEN